MPVAFTIKVSNTFICDSFVIKLYRGIKLYRRDTLNEMKCVLPFRNYCVRKSSWHDERYNVLFFLLSKNLSFATTRKLLFHLSKSNTSAKAKKKKSICQQRLSIPSSSLVAEIELNKFHSFFKFGLVAKSSMIF